MVKVDEAFELRFKQGKENFEVLVDFDKLQEFLKKPDEVDVYDVLADTKIFKDQKKGEVASENHLKEVFGNIEESEILKIILKKGECQIPTAYLNRLREEKKSQIVNYIAENAFNPQSKTKYTASMIQNTFDKIKFNVDPLKNYVNQAEEVLKLLKKEMPISMEKVLMIIQISGQYCGNFYGPFRKLGQIKKEYFDNEGNLHIHFEVSESEIDKVATFIKQNSNETGEYYVKKD